MQENHQRSLKLRALGKSSFFRLWNFSKLKVCEESPSIPKSGMVFNGNGFAQAQSAKNGKCHRDENFALAKGNATPPPAVQSAERKLSVTKCFGKPHANVRRDGNFSQNVRLTCRFAEVSRRVIFRASGKQD